MKPKIKSAAAARTAAAVEAEIGVHQDRHAAAVAEIEQLRAQRPTMLLDATPEGEEALDELERAIRRAERTIERTAGDEGSIAALRKELKSLRRSDEQARRWALYEAGKKAEVEYRRLGNQDYVEAAERVAAIMARMSALDGIVQQANLNRPDDLADQSAYNHGMPLLTCDPAGADRLPNLRLRVFLPSFAPRDPDIWNPRAPR